MPGSPPFEEALHDLGRLLEAAGRYRERLVLCGGWAPYLYRRMPGLSAPSRGPCSAHPAEVEVWPGGNAPMKLL